MKHAWQFLKREFLELLPPTIFFFIAIGLLMLTKRLILKQYGFSNFAFDFASVLIGALIVGKIVLIADLFSFVNRYPGKPLIYNVLWKTAIYLIAATVVRIGEEVIPKLLQHGGLKATIQHLVDGIVWPHFWVIHLWLGILLFGYCALRELIRAVGKYEVLRMFLGWQRG
jgi:hypothetical protein